MLKKRLSFRLPLIITTVLAIAAICTAAYFYSQYKKLKDSSTDTSQSQVKELTTKIGQFMELPTNETPAIATITDITKLKGQQFFTTAQNGDIVIIYSKAKKAILYRPGTNKIIDFSFIETDVQSTTPTPSSKR